MPPDHLSATFAALADPTRRAILARLATGESSVKDLAEPSKISPPAVTKHLKVLQRAGLITQGRQAQWRPCRLEAAPLKDIAEWAEGYRRFWDASFDRLVDVIGLAAVDADDHDRSLRPSVFAAVDDDGRAFHRA